MTRTRIKICGFTRVGDAESAVDLGVDALGLVFVPSSPRYVDQPTAKRIISALPPFAQSVGLFMNQPYELVSQILDNTALNLLQFHGDESPEFCEQFDRPYIKAIPMGGGVNPVEYAAQYDHSVGFLLDSHHQGGTGGSGDKFDWDKIPSNFSKRVILAGGLTIDNVVSAVERVKPYAVDVSSGVESQKGIKATEKMAAFIKGVELGDKQRDTNSK